MDFGLSTIASLSTSTRVRIITGGVAGIMSIAGWVANFGSDTAKGTAEAAGSAAISAKADLEGKLATTGEGLAKTSADAQAGLQASVQQSAELVSSVKPTPPSISVPPVRTNVRVEGRGNGGTTFESRPMPSDPSAGGEVSGDVQAQGELNGTVNGVIDGVVDTAANTAAGVDLEAKADLAAKGSLNGGTDSCTRILWFEFC